MGVPTWQYGTRTFKSADTIVNTLRSELDKIREPCNVTAWMDLVRTARHPHMLWAIDYIQGSQSIGVVNQIITESETLLYGDTSSLKLKPGYKAEDFQEVTFHTVRAHIRAEEGSPELAAQMFDNMLDVYYDDIALIRQSNLLMHACLCFLCCKWWDKSFDCLQRHWGLLKYSSPNERESLGLWDNELIMRQIYWFFSKHCMDFRNFYTSKIGLQSTQEVWKHKKIGLLHLLEYDNSWVVSFCSLPLYNHARTLMSLPEYNIQLTTPINMEPIHDDSVELNGPVQEDLQYLDKLQSLMNRNYSNFEDAIHLTDVKDCLFSYLDFRVNVTKNRNMITNLSVYINELLGYDIFERKLSILDAGCGTCLYDFGFRRSDGDYVGVDVSDRIYNKLNKTRMNCVHSEINAYLEHEDKKFDICWSCGMLPELAEDEVMRFLHLISVKCNMFATVMELDDDLQTIKGIDNWLEPTEYCSRVEDTFNIHQTMWASEKWVEVISVFFEVQHYEAGNLLYLLCTKKT